MIRTRTGRLPTISYTPAVSQLGFALMLLFDQSDTHYPAMTRPSHLQVLTSFSVSRELFTLLVRAVCEAMIASSEVN